VRLGKELTSVAARALRLHLASLGPRVLPLREQAKYALGLAARRLAAASKAAARRMPAAWWSAPGAPPDFASAFEHVCIHTGGRGVIDAIERQLALPAAAVLPSRAALYRFGNTSSASIWYVLAYTEALGRVRAGDRVWQLAFGSGFKVNSAVWVAARDVRDAHAAWDGFDEDRMVRGPAGCWACCRGLCAGVCGPGCSGAPPRGRLVAVPLLLPLREM
jgi:3-ketoacyl-CoA synthase